MNVFYCKGNNSNVAVQFETFSRFNISCSLHSLNSHSFLSLKNLQKTLQKLTKKKGFWPQQEQQIRHCFHPGASSFSNESLGDVNAPDVSSSQMIRAMMAYIWPKDDAMIRKR